jgi:hypothetical protein
MSSVRSSATAALADGKVKTSFTLEVGDMSVAGVRVVLTDKGLVLPGQTVPLPDTSPVLKPLEDAGVAVELVQPEKLNGGIRSGGVRVVTTQATPDGSSVTQSYTFGQSLAVVAATSDDTPLSAAPNVGAAPPAAAPQPAGTVSGGAVAPGTGAAPQLAPAPEPNQAPAVAGPALVPSAAVGSAPFAQMKTLSFYLVIVLAGAVTVASHAMLRRFGVSATWTS